MSSTKIRKYMTQDFDVTDKKAYIDYIEGNNQSTSWMEKALLRRDTLIVLQLKCDIQVENGSICNEWINIDEKGICKCSNNHYRSEQVISNLHKASYIRLQSSI